MIVSKVVNAQFNPIEIRLAEGITCFFSKLPNKSMSEEEYIDY